MDLTLTTLFDYLILTHMKKYLAPLKENLIIETHVQYICIFGKEVQ